MSKPLGNSGKTMGTLPVFMTAVSTILGAILFLKFGYSLAHVGLIGTLGIILIGHLVTVPTAMAVAEIATNQKVEGGGAYYIISRSFGLSIGGAIGIALYLSQAISIAFYVIAFTESCEGILMYLSENQGIVIPKILITFTMMGLLSVLILTKGANLGVKALYLVVVILVISLAMFFLGSKYPEVTSFGPWETLKNIVIFDESGKRIQPDNFFYVFSIIFPAFTGIAAGLGLSGDLKYPKVAIPKGTLWATVVGIIIYVAVAFKLFYSADMKDLATEGLVMSKIAIWSPIIPIGLACAAISSALGSIMIAPRTLQALATDKVFPGNINSWLGKTKNSVEPINASILTCIIAFIFCAFNDINAVAEIITMFFMVTYGAICMISFFEHFAADPSYRPTFRSRWYLSLGGGVLCLYLMFKMNTSYAFLSVALMVVFYFWISSKDKDKTSGLENLFKGVLFQLSRQVQIFLQRSDVSEEGNWRPFILSISGDSFKRKSSFDMVRWIAHKYGFGTYIHYLEGRFNEKTNNQAYQIKSRLIEFSQDVKSRVTLDTIISPDYTTAIEQSIQMAGISGKGHNMILFEYADDDSSSMDKLFIQGDMLKASSFDTCVLRTSIKGFGYKRNIHVWITPSDYINSNLMILLSYIIMGHPEWKKAEISIFSIYDEGQLSEKRKSLNQLIKMGRLPISPTNIQLIKQGKNNKEVINRMSGDADLTIIGYNDDELEKQGKELFMNYTNLGNTLHVNATHEKEIELN